MDAAAELDFLGIPPAVETALGSLTEPVRRWFTARYETPTAAQRLAWPMVSRGEHLLLSASTGTGKTLAALLPVLDRLLTYPSGSHVRCIYLAPLKALIHDVLRNLSAPLRQIQNFLPAETRMPRLGARTGDTPARVRRRLHAQPPDVLLTTPESLAVLLSQPETNELFRWVESVVIDEVHALADNKRGADLALSLERLETLTSNSFQRIGLSATCTPLAEAARFLVGVGRRCLVAHVPDTAPLHVEVELLEAGGGVFLGRLLDRLGPEIEANRSTLIFTNTRRLAERLSWSLRRRYPAWSEAIAAHHSSLSADRRRDLERRFKSGELRALVSSTSLELGIDVGPVDGVVLVHPPGGVVRLLQRVGRGGHAPGRPRRGLVLTAGPAALLEAAVTAGAGRLGQQEALRVPEHPLDVLCQHLLGMAVTRSWSADDMFSLVKRAYPYCDLTRDDFEACLAYLSGAQGGPTRLRRDGTAFRIRDDHHTRLLRCNLGSIVSTRTCRVVIREETSANAAGRLVGELDAGYGEQLQPGDRFLLDGRCLEFRQRRSGALLVDEVFGRPAAPHWSGPGWPLAPELVRRLYLLRSQAAEALRESRAALARLLAGNYGLSDHAIDALAGYLERQERVSEVPSSCTLLIEMVRRYHGTEYYFHTPLNRAANEALARVAVHRLACDRGRSALSMVAELGMLLMVRGSSELSPEDWRGLLTATGFEPELTTALEGSARLLEHYREIAQTGLLRPRRRFGRDAFPSNESAFVDGDFALMRQAWREAKEGARETLGFLENLPRWAIHARRLAEISPFVEGWNHFEAGPMLEAVG
jgi:ATP-dependent Lhr-like helicase